MKDKVSVRFFLENDLKARLQNEIDSYIGFQKNDAYDGFDIITYNEIALLSLIKSAMIRGKKPSEVWAMQEYQVYEGNKYKGRGDLFVMFRGNQQCDLLIEAKRDGLFEPKAKNIGNELEETHRNLENTMSQALKYSTAEMAYFNSPAYIITMFFAHLDKKHLEVYKGSPIISPPEKLYYEFDIAVGERLLYIYGEVYKSK